MNDLKKCFKLLPYAVGFKRQIVFAVIMVLIGVLLEVVNGCSNGVGGFYIALVGSIPSQLLLMVTVPTVVKASPLCRRISVEFYALLNFLCELICYTIVVVVHLIYAAVNPERSDISMSLVLLVAVVVLISEIIMPVMYKHYWASFAVLMITVCGLFGVLARYIYGDDSFHFGMPVYLIGGYALVILGLLGSIAVNRLFYKHELHPMCYRNMMKKLDGSI